jgi:asparagine synthase (glutamine-hydrolysing)
MCGITGFWDTQKILSSDKAYSILKSMTDAIDFRGPDGAGYDYDPQSGVGFGHRRLSIIDLSEAGHQPMVSANKRFLMTYNGELYNTDDLRHTLIAEGKSFRGRSDTEVLLEYIDSFGIEKALKDANGMFALAVFDTHYQRLYLARDHIGIKPLFWGVDKGAFIFASTLKPFFQNLLFKSEMNGECLHNYFTFNTIPAPQTILKNCYQLLPGHYLVFEKGGEPKTQCYYSIPQNNTDKEFNFEDLLKVSIKSQMVSDVPLGVFLSGGIDSSLITALAQSVSDKPVKTFTIGFEEDSHDESRYAKQIANHLGTDHHVETLTMNRAKDIIADLPDYYDQPFADSSQLPSLLLSEMAKKHVTVCLSGDGADELFNGYDRYIYGENIFKKADLINKVPGARCGLSMISRCGLDHIIKKPENISLKLRKLAEMAQQDLLSVQYRTLINLWMDNPSVRDSSNDDVIFSSMRHHDMHYYLPNDILHKMDRASMAHSLEVRVPYLDPTVINAAFQTPVSQHGQKQILKDMLKKYIPENLYDRPKSGFSVPVAQWMRADLKELCHHYFQKDKLEDGGYLNAKPILQKWAQHDRGTHNHQHALWGVLMLQMWREHYKI